MTSLIKLPRSFYLRPTLAVARDLPGKYLVRRLDRRILVGRIVEVEAYLGTRDPASHAYRGMTPRNTIMFGDGGHLYVYFTYGMHFCCNVVTEREGRACAALIRAIEPIEGLEVMRGLRSQKLRRPLKKEELCNGPGKACQAFGIGREENGTDLCGDTIWLARNRGYGPRPRLARSPRIGITNGREHMWRYAIRGNAFVSRKPGVT